ncbi:hypothetical protein [Reichenbachiella sp. MALMAid0571]|uniref:hypothetical protein n=1 Tax=Reichenbachiella sp. MALMAid0571 TaxID=3143939 RepID=UPI0032DF2A25
MCRFIESICCIDGELLNLNLHQERIDKTCQRFFSGTPISLKDHLTNIPKSGKFKARIVYDDASVLSEFIPYVKKDINSLKVVHGDNIDYAFKYEDRSELTKLFDLRENYNDIIIVKNGLCTDSYFANLAFFDGINWATPKKPLLNGVKRQRLIQESKLTEADIAVESISTFEKVSLINAMLDLDEVSVSVERIF